MGVRAWSVVALAAACVVSGCTTGHASATYQIQGLRSSADHQSLVAFYIGGSCDGPARLDVTESADRIDAEVHVDPGPDGWGVCNAAGHSRSVTARLAAPIGTRTIWSGNRRHVPFDGAQLLSSASPSTPSEFGGSTEYEKPVDVTDTWSMTYTDPGPAVAGGACDPALGTLRIDQEPQLRDDFIQASVKVDTARVGTATATLYRSRVAYPSGPLLTYVWPFAQGVVELSADIRCGHYRSLTPDELLRVARSLRPA